MPIIETNTAIVKVEAKPFQYDIIITDEPLFQDESGRIISIYLSNLKKSGVDLGHYVVEKPRGKRSCIRVLFATNAIEDVPELPVTLKRKDTETTYRVKLKGTWSHDETDEGRIINSHVNMAQWVKIVLTEDGLQRFKTDRLVPLKGGFYDLARATNLTVRAGRDQHRILLAPGFRISVRPHKNISDELILSVLPDHARFRGDTAGDLLRRESDPSRALQKLTGLVAERGRRPAPCVVSTPWNGCTYKVLKVDFDFTPLSPFPAPREGTDKPTFASYLDYFRKTHPNIETMFSRLHIRDIWRLVENDRCMLSCVSTLKRRAGGTRGQTVLLPPSICVLTGDPPSAANNPGFLREITKHSHLQPREMMQRADRLLSRIQEDAIVDSLKHFSISISQERRQIRDSVSSQMPRIMTGFSRSRRSELPDRRSGSLRSILRDFVMVQPPRQSRKQYGLRSWCIVGLGQDRRQVNELEDRFMQLIDRMMPKNDRGQGPPLRRPKNIALRTTQADAAIREIVDFKREEAANGERLQLAVVILPDKDSSRYSHIKTSLLAEGVVSQCIVEDRGKWRNDKLCGCLQQAMAKVGAVVWQPEWPIWNDQGSQRVMLVGLDVSRPMGFGGSRDSTCSMGFVSTTDPSLVRVFPQGFRYTAGEGRLAGEISNNVTQMLKKAITRFRLGAGGQTPRDIIIFRDGVSDSQMAAVRTHEVEPIKQLLSTMPTPSTLTFVVVQKNSSLRLSDRGQNVQLGTCFWSTEFNPACDPLGSPPRHVMTMVSQDTGRHGTAKPAEYHILEGRPEDPEWKRRFSNLVFASSFSYVNYAGPIATPHILKHAHVLSKHIGEVLKDDYRACGEVPGSPADFDFHFFPYHI
eukprot:gnl/Dysnectes_brevis/3844_a4960_727.p1 GENE.gnl/Dysnectes_brevis/3844_a4960_727~~gnl/Dysnectes_brevis/3844_a4960_727.p1  ORF type:complete len:875 (-),score=318.98 gnl/Dysnectes_brevis/3844_a4960_727:33-2624(-)